MDNLNKIKVAVIGVGNMGKNHVRTYSEINRVHLVGISDLDERLGNDIAQKFNTKFFRSFKELVKFEKPEIVSICTPTKSHYDIAKFCMEEKVNVLLEKPIALTVEEAEKLLDISKEKKVKFLVGHIERYNPAVKKVKDMIDKGELGKIISVFTRRVGGFPPQIKDSNIAVDLAIHDVDIVNYFLDKLPIEVVSNKQRNHIENREDSVEFFLKYGDTSAYVQANWITPVKIRKVNITGSEGYLEMDFITQQIEFYKSNYEKLKENTKDFSDYILRFSEPDKITISVAKKEPLKEELFYFINAVENDEKIDSKFALEALKIVLR